MTESLIDQGLELLVFGMGTVLAFLTVLVIAISIMSALLKRYFPMPEEPVTAAQKPAPLAAGNPDLVAVISAAVHRYRSKN